MSSRPLIGRRQFLIASSACAVATAAIGPKLFASEPGAAPRRLAVGFARFDETAVFSASGIPAGDGAFIGRGARISVSGASGASADPKNRRAVELLTHYSYFDGAERKLAPFRAWACSRATGCQGNTVNFTVPVDEMQKIAFSVETERGGLPHAGATRRDLLAGAAPDAVALPVTLTLASGEGMKLVRGFYIIVPMYDDDREPRWSSFELKKVDGRWAMVDHDGNVAPFEHFVLRIDYAS